MTPITVNDTSLSFWHNLTLWKDSVVAYRR